MPRSHHLLALAGLVLLLPAALAGCGYRVDGRESASAPAAGPRLAIRTLANASNEPGLERLVSEALRRECTRRGRFALEGDPDRADWVIEGRVLPLRIETRTLSSVVLALEQTVTLEVELAMWPRAADGEARGGRVAPGLLSESEIYFASADLEATRKNRAEALRRVADLIAERVADAFAVEVAP